MPRIPAGVFEIERQLKPVFARVFADLAKFQESQVAAIVKDLPAIEANPERKHLAKAATQAAKELAESAQRTNELRKDIDQTLELHSDAVVVAGTVISNGKSIPRQRVRLREARGTEVIQVVDGNSRGRYSVEIPSAKTRTDGGMPISFIVEAVTADQQPIAGSQSEPFDFGQGDNFFWIPITIPIITERAKRSAVADRAAMQPAAKTKNAASRRKSSRDPKA